MRTLSPRAWIQPSHPPLRCAPAPRRLTLLPSILTCLVESPEPTGKVCLWAAASSALTAAASRLTLPQHCTCTHAAKLQDPSLELRLNTLPCRPHPEQLLRAAQIGRAPRPEPIQKRVPSRRWSGGRHPRQLLQPRPLQAPEQIQRMEPVCSALAPQLMVRLPPQGFQPLRDLTSSLHA